MHEEQDNTVLLAAIAALKETADRLIRRVAENDWTDGAVECDIARSHLGHIEKMLYRRKAGT